MEHRPDGQRVLVRVEEPAASDALEEVAGEQVGDTLVVVEVEPLVHVGTVDDGLHALEPLVGLVPVHQPGVAREFAVDAVGGDDDVRLDGVEFVEFDAHDTAPLPEEAVHAHVGEQPATGLAAPLVDL